MHYLYPLILEWEKLTTTPPGISHFMFWFFVCVFVLQLILYWFFYLRMATCRMPELKLLDPKPPVSVIIAARDEYLNLYENLPAILEQEYPDFEVIVVNNESTDDSATLLRNFQEQYENLKVITLERNLNFFKGKKFPLSLGIRAAKNDILVFTDADCKPASPHWLNHMQSGFINDTGIVLGVGQYMKKPGLLNALIRFETFMIAIQYLSFAIANIPYMGVGRNLAYRKSLFMRQKGFISHYMISSGDDDLFVNQASKVSAVNIRIHPDAHTFSRPVTNLRHYLIQKRRHFTTARYYRPSHKIILGLISLSQFLFFAFLILNIVMMNFVFITMIAFTLRWISQCIIIKITTKKLRIKILYVLSPFMELSLMFLHILAVSANIFSKPARWK